VHAYRDAAKSARKALDVWQKGDAEEERLRALEKLAHCAQVSGQFGDAIQALREVIQSQRVITDPGRAGEAHRKLANVLVLQGHWEPSLEVREKSAVAFEKAGLPEEAALEWLAAAIRNTGMYNLSTALSLTEKAEKLAQKSQQPDIMARTLALKGNILAMMGKFEAGLEAGHSGLDLALQNNATEAASEAYRRLGSTLEYASEYESSKDTYYTAYNYCQTRGANTQAQLCLSCMSWVLFRTGDWKQCLDICRDVIKDRSSTPQTRGLAKCVRALIQVHRGEYRNARKNLQDALNQGYRYEAVALKILSLWGLALLDKQDEDLEKVSTHYQKILGLRESARDSHDALLPICSAVTFYASQSRDKETARCINALAEMASSSSNTEALGALAFSLGENALMNTNAQEAVQQFKQALQHFEKLKTPLELAKIEERLGGALIDAGEKNESIPHLKNSYQLYRKLGCRSLASRVAEILETTGVPAEERRSPESKERAARGGLTSRQLEILRLIADGLTNKEIAGKLFLSPRTVEMHVANLLDRLDCRSRSEAVHRAGELGLLV
jgi:DNA-binding CsgD family transcriptional regulator